MAHDGRTDVYLAVQPECSRCSRPGAVSGLISFQKSTRPGIPSSARTPAFTSTPGPSVARLAPTFTHQPGIHAEVTQGQVLSEDLGIPVKPRYGGRITKSVRIAAHRAFWDVVLRRSQLRAVATTNYDLFAERGLRYRRFQRPSRPGFFYGGIPQPQALQGLAQPWTVLDQQRTVILDGSVPLYKLHGSLNWANEQGALVMYQDMRPAFRRGSDALIVPPVAEKETPVWLSDVWTAAEECLAGCDTWIVCGYFLPNYDVALQELFTRAAAGGMLRSVYLLDPIAAPIAARWTNVAPTATLIPLPGLPDAVADLARLL